MSDNKETIYNYFNTDGVYRYSKIRTDYSDGSKKFCFKQANGNYGIGNEKHLLYNLPDVVTSDTIYFVEGEKCAEAVKACGYVSTTLDTGANSKWRPQYTEWIKDKTVYIIPDCDEAGIKYAKEIKKNIPWGKVVQLDGLNEKEDIYDWLQAGHSMTEIASIPETDFDKKASDNSNSATNKKTQSKILLDLLKKERIEYFLNENNDAFAEIVFNNHKVIYALDSSDFTLWVQMIYYRGTGGAIKKDSLNQTIELLTAEAKFGNVKKYTLYNRVAKQNDYCFWYDLCNSNWSAIKITADGWSIEEKTPKLFYRYRHQAEQVIPANNGDLFKIFDYVNIKKYKTLFLCWLVSCFVPDIPHPMPIIFGEKGASKTTACVLLKQLIDPSSLETLTLNKDILINLQQHYYLPFDNVSKISNEMSDTLCRAITGGAVQQRKLYTNADDYIFTFKRCLTLNGICNVANRSDLLDRSILFELERIPASQRMELNEVYNSFEKDKPYILGAIFNTLASAMKIYPQIKLSNLPRMADFCRWGYAIGQALDDKGNEFLDDYNCNQSIQNDEALKADYVSSLLLEFMFNHSCWNGLVSQLLKELKSTAESQGISPYNSNIPQASNSLSRRLSGMRSNLEKIGITFTFNKSNARGTFIEIINKNISPLPPYTISPTDSLKSIRTGYGDNGDNGDKINKLNIPTDEDDSDNVEF